MGGRAALVTGAARGIGFAIARALGAQGHAVAILDRLPAAEAVASLAAEGVTARAFACDLADPDAIPPALAEVRAALGDPAIFVHAAGVFPETPTEALTLDLWRRVFAVNLDAAMLIARELAPGMKAAGWGRMVMIASGTIASPRREVVPYVSSKLGLVGLARALASDLGPHGVTVNTVAPGFIRTEGTIAKFDRIDALAASVVRRQTVPREEEPEDVAAAVAFLVSDEAGMITGQTWMADGGTAML